MDKSFAKKIEQSLQAARLYYESELSQAKIAQEMQLSRPTVARLLAFAKQHDLVKVTIQNPYQTSENLAVKLAQRYALKKVKVVQPPFTHSQNLDAALGKTTAAYLTEIVHDHDIIGVSWGKTINAVAQYLTPQTAKQVKIVELKGNVTYTQTPIFAETILAKFGQAFQTAPYKLALPVVFQNKETHDLVLKDRWIASMIALGKQANIALYTVGTIRDDALLFKTGYFEQAEQAYLKKTAVGDICSRFFNEQGQIAWPELDARTVGIQLADLKKKSYAILVAGGQRKLKPIKAALLGGYANVLITDEQTAQSLLND